MNKPEYIIVHHSAPPLITDRPQIGIINEYHKQKEFPKSSLGYYVGYHYVIEKTGQIWKTRNDEEIGAHTIGYNDKSIGICLSGNFDLEYPSETQKSALQSLLNEKVVRYDLSIDKVVPHRQFAPKTCYGSNLSDDWAKNLLIENKKINILKQLVGLYSKLISLLKT